MRSCGMHVTNTFLARNIALIAAPLLLHFNFEFYFIFRQLSRAERSNSANILNAQSLYNTV